MRAVGLAILILATPAAAESYRVPSACSTLAKMYGVPDVLDRDQAVRARDQLDRFSWVFGARACRNAIRRQWKL
jgi:hypothetical protein